MRWLVLVLVSVFLFGYEVSIKSVNKNKAFLNETVQKGKSGIVLCPYNGMKIICARAVSFGDYAKLYTYDDLKNDAFALPLVKPKRGDGIVFGKDDKRIMIIAPTQTQYLKLKEKYKDSVVISSDVFASYIDELPKKKNFIEFAKKMNIGKYIFVLDKIYEVDAYSFYVLNSFGSNSDKYKKIFFTTYPDFDIKSENIIKYYKKFIKE